MRFFIVDDDEVVRSMLTQIIEDDDLGEVVGEAEDGSFVDHHILESKKVDILLIDLMMPVQDGIETVRNLASFSGKIIMISQVETKDLIGEAYSLGVEYYITKPINRLEVCSVIQKVSERLRLEKSIYHIKQSLDFALGKAKEENPFTERSIIPSGKFLLAELGIIDSNGSKDLLDVLQYLFQLEKEKSLDYEFPLLKDIFYQVAKNKIGKTASPEQIHKEMKAIEQRIRRAIMQSMSHFASIGLTDFTNPKFEKYASTFFDFAEIRKKMLELEGKTGSSIRLNPKKFIQVLYLEAKRLIG
ncbi:response regulator [Thermoflavimicrobium dichotomicum]|uniref:Two-component system, response regulator YcbB n=1 Tax=Thermoflavimicrobium dichotomicum TaxID=46223 RepID=A0A1I3UUC9_9BACL|nr:response regulator [Thermoflavimicrobium dichotomicum]SFJ86383.1 two-component system, response regulator YcbB [Thermoflavimicrobium dichotomicum]